MDAAEARRPGPLAHATGAVGIGGQVAAAFFFILLPAFTAPSPANYRFFVAWALLLGLAIAWWRHHALRSLLVPMVSVPLCLLPLEMGKRNWNWVP
jgi:hypothetical protein